MNARPAAKLMPADGAWQVMMAIRQQRAEQYEAERQKAPSFLEWLRALNPMGVAMGASLATLVIGGVVMVWARSSFGGINLVHLLLALVHFLSLPILGSMGLLGLHILKRYERS